MPDDEQQEKPQGPTDPSGPGGADAPAPPGGPQRTDQPAGTQTPGTAAPEPDRSDRPSERGGDGHEQRSENEIPEPVATDPEQSERARRAQEENAETSLDQPSQ